MSTAATSVDGRTARAQKQREARRGTVLEAALRVFSDKGYHQTRIADIIEEASIARGTFYLYFDSKSAIFHELLTSVLSRIRDVVRGVDLGDGAPPMRDQLLMTVRLILETFREDRALAKLILREAVGVDEEIDAMLDGFYRHIHGWLRDSLTNGTRIGLIRDVDASLTSWLILGSVKQFAQLVLETPDEKLDLDHLAVVILDFNLQGIRTD